MKNPLLLFLLVTTVYQLKAQQFFPVKPADSITFPGKLFKIKPDNSYPLFSPKLNLYHPFNYILAEKLASNTSHMPVAVLEGYSKMPVVKIGGYYTMPVKKIGGEGLPLNNQNFKTP